MRPVTKAIGGGVATGAVVGLVVDDALVVFVACIVGMFATAALLDRTR